MTIRFIAASQLPTPWATFTMHGFEDEATGKDHIALTLGDVTGDAPVLGRVHSECLTGDALFSMRCDCGYHRRLLALLPQISVVSHPNPTDAEDSSAAVSVAAT